MSVVMMVVLALAAQAADPIPKTQTQVTGAQPDAVKTKLGEAERLLHNGRYAEAEEKLAAVESEINKQTPRPDTALRVAIALDKAECQASQGAYAKAIDGLKAAVAANPKSAESQQG